MEIDEQTLASLTSAPIGYKHAMTYLSPGYNAGTCKSYIKDRREYLRGRDPHIISVTVHPETCKFDSKIISLMKRFINYWDSRVKAKRTEFKIIPNNNNLLIAFDPVWFKYPSRAESFLQLIRIAPSYPGGKMTPWQYMTKISTHINTYGQPNTYNLVYTGDYGQIKRALPYYEAIREGKTKPADAWGNLAGMLGLHSAGPGEHSRLNLKLTEEEE